MQPAADRAEFAFFAHAIEELHDPERRFTLSPDHISLLNPNTRTCPTFRSRRDAELAKAIYRRVPVLIRRAQDGQPEENPWGIRFDRMFDMANDSHLFRTRKQLEAHGWKLEGNVFRRETEECLPLYEAKMVHHFDHRWASFRVEGGRKVTVEVPLQDKENAGFIVLPRYWVAAREVHLRIADLPKGMLAALRDRNTDLIVLAVCHLLFIDRLRQESAGSADAAVHRTFPTWLEFIERHPVAQSFAPTQMGLCGDSPLSIQPLGPNYLPAEPLDKVKTGPRLSTAWYAVDAHALLQSFASFEPYGKLLDSVPPLRTEDEALAFAEELLSRASPRWLMGWRDITNSTNVRTVVGGVFPFSSVGDNLAIWTTESEFAVLLPALLTSLACDFAARFKVGGTHLNFFIAEQIPVLPPDGLDISAPWDPGESLRDWLLPRVLELTYTAWDLEPFAADCDWNGPPFRWDEERRFLLRCELDAAFFHLYLPTEENGDWRPARRSDGCPHDETPEQLTEFKHRFPTPRDGCPHDETRPDQAPSRRRHQAPLPHPRRAQLHAVAYILDTFPIVRRKDEQRHGEYRTKRTILDIYNSMQTSIATGEPYRTRLTPPPADPKPPPPTPHNCTCPSATG